MTNVVFQNLRVSPYTKRIINDRFEQIRHKFPDLETHNVRFRLSVDNSPKQAGIDCYTAHVMINGKRYHDINMEKSDTNIFVALSTLFDRLHEKLHRFGERRRTKFRRTQKKNSHLSLVPPVIEEQDDDEPLTPDPIG